MEDATPKRLARTQSTKNLVFGHQSEIGTVGGRRWLMAGKVAKQQWFPTEETCVFCRRKIKMAELPLIIHRSLFGRHSNSLNFYYTKDLNKIIAETHSPALVKFQEAVLSDKREECLTEFYRLSDLKQNMDSQWRYHQFNIDQPRVFIKSLSEVIEGYFSSKRKLQDMAIRRMLELLSDSELERCELDLEPFMHENIEIQEKHAPDLTMAALQDLYQSVIRKNEKVNKVTFETSSNAKAKPKLSTEQRPSISVSLIAEIGRYEIRSKDASPLLLFYSAAPERLEETDEEELLQQLGQKSSLTEWPSFLTRQAVLSLESKCQSSQQQLMTDRTIKNSHQTAADLFSKSAKLADDKLKNTKKLQKGFLKAKEPTVIAATALGKLELQSGKKQSSLSNLKSMKMGLKLSESKKTLKLEEPAKKEPKTSAAKTSNSQHKSKKNISQVDSVGPVATVSQKTASNKPQSIGLYPDGADNRVSLRTAANPKAVFSKTSINSFGGIEFVRAVTSPDNKHTHLQKKSLSSQKLLKRCAEVPRPACIHLPSTDQLKIINAYGVNKNELIHSKVARKATTALKQRPTAGTIVKQATTAIHLSKSPIVRTSQKSLGRTRLQTEVSQSPSQGKERRSTSSKNVFKAIKSKDWKKVIQLKKNFISETEQQQMLKPKSKRSNNRSPSAGVCSSDEPHSLMDRISSNLKLKHRNTLKPGLLMQSPQDGQKEQKSLLSKALSTSNNFIEKSPHHHSSHAKSRKASPKPERNLQDSQLKGQTSRSSQMKKPLPTKRTKL